MFLLYSILLTLAVLAMLPAFAWDALRHGKYVAGLRERAGAIKDFQAGGRPVIWLHCVSVGEAQAARPLARALAARFPTHALVVSTTTLTGQRVAREAFRDLAASVFYFPFDWAWSVRRALDRVRPRVVLLMETEIWFRFLRECHARGVAVAVVNGRLSEKSFRRYKLIGGFTRRVVRLLSLAVMQTEDDAARVRALGLAPTRVAVSGNVKFDADDDTTSRAATDGLRARFALDGRRPLVLAASTHAPEERIIVEAFRQLLTRAAADNGALPRLLVAPRHPERFAEVAALLDSSDLAWARRSAAPSASDARADAILLDTVGELRAAYPLAEVVFVGGSVAATGGHNVLEPAAASRAIVTGAHTFNFTEIMRRLRARDAVVQLPALDEDNAIAELARTFRELLRDGERRRQLGANALAVLNENRGATARTVELLTPLLRRSEVRDQRSCAGD
ncbi:MAG: 3-deoxy-D-manno-octulosonic acid transferase [Acidobacteria bacterium]|nr:3-deoxy-D-manno-octulosonic acid transferase [Acidobacteriota bacterium]